MTTCEPQRAARSADARLAGRFKRSPVGAHDGPTERVRRRCDALRRDDSDVIRICQGVVHPGIRIGEEAQLVLAMPPFVTELDHSGLGYKSEAMERGTVRVGAHHPGAQHWGASSRGQADRVSKQGIDDTRMVRQGQEIGNDCLTAVDANRAVRVQ